MKVKSSTHDRVEGTAKQVRGKAKIAAGRALRRPGLQAKGALDVLDGKTQKAAGRISRARGR